MIAGLMTAPGGAHAQGFGGTVKDLLVRGDSLLLQQRPKEAMVQYQEVRTLCPSQVEIFSSLRGEGRARLLMGDFKPAAGLFVEAADRFPEDPRAAELLYLAGGARQRAGDAEGGAVLLRRALESSPTPDILPMIKFQLAQAVKLQGKPGEVIELLTDFETDFAGESFLPKVLYTLAIAYHDIGEMAQAESVYREIIQRFPATQAAIETQLDLAAVLAERGKRREAVDFYRRFASDNPNSPFVAGGLERAGDLLLFRAPKESALLYAMAAVKAGANPTPAVPGMAVSRWLGTKRGVAGALSRGWVVAVVGIGILAGLAGVAVLGRRLVRRFRPPERAGA